MYEFALRTVLGTFTHQIIPALHLTPWTYSIIDSSYSIAFLIFSIPIGMITDKFGIRWTMTITMLVLSLATLLYSTASGFYQALFSRLLMGAGSSLSFVSVVVIIMMWFPKKRFAFLVGISQFIATIGPMLGGGPLIAYIHYFHETWRMGVRDIGYVGLIIAALMLIFIKEKKRSQEIEKHYIQGVGQVLHHLKLLFKSKQAWATVLFPAACYSGFQLLCTVWGVEYLQTRGISQQIAANAVSIGWIGYAIGCPLLGFVSDLSQKRQRYMSFAAVLGIIMASSLVYLPTLNTTLYMIIFFCLGIAASGCSLSYVLLAEKVNVAIKASATAFNNSMISFFVIGFTLFSSAFINHATHSNIKNIQPHDFMWAFTILPLSFVVALVLSSLVLKEKKVWFMSS